MLGCSGVRGSGMFGSESVTRVTSVCPAGTVAWVALATVLDSSSRTCRRHVLLQVCAPLVPWVWGPVADVGRCHCDCPSGLCAHCVLDSEMAGLSGTRAGVLAATAPGCALGPFSLPSSLLALPLLGSFSYPEVWSNCGGRAWDAFLVSELGQDCLREGRSGRCSSVRALGAKEAALSPPGWPAPSSRPTLVKTEAKGGPSRELPQDTAVLGKRCSPSGSHCFLPEQGGGQ